MSSMLKNIHFYRKTPSDLTYGTSSGGAVSIVALVVMSLLFISQINMYMTVQVSTQVQMDPQISHKMAIDFDITLAKVPCRLLSVDFFDVLGRSRINMTTDAEKHNFRVAKTSVITNQDMMYIPGAKQKVEDGPLPREILKRHHTEGEAMKALEKFPVSEHKDWKENWDTEVYAKVLTDANFQETVSQYKFVMINFHAPWCPWCSRLKPVWEHAAGLIEKTTAPYGDEVLGEGFKDMHEALFQWEAHNADQASPVSLQEFLLIKRKEKGLGVIPAGEPQVLLAKVDCTQEQMLCRKQRIMGFPTIRVYTPKPEDKEITSFREYDGDRTAQDLLQYVHENLPSLGGFTDMDDEFVEMQRQVESELSTTMEKRLIDNGDAHGCNVVGSIAVNKVPGTLMMTAHSNYKSLSLQNLNMSHIIHHLAYRPTEDPILSKLTTDEYHESRASTNSNVAGYGAYARALMREHKAALEARTDVSGFSSVRPFMFPMDQTRFTATKQGCVLMHYLKVVHTFLTPAGSTMFDMFQHQVHSTADVVLPEGGHPTLNFTYDMSPLSYTITGKYEPTADFLTSTCAIIGGVFTVIGLFDNVIYHSATNFLELLK